MRKKKLYNTSIPGKKKNLLKVINRSSHRPVKKVVLINFAKFTRKHLCQSLFVIKLRV